MISNAWNYEELKITIYFDGGSLTITSDDSVNNKLFINKANASANENGSSNPFGIMGSRDYSISIVDIDDVLNPTNTSSPYYGKIKNGSKVELVFKGADDQTYKADGTYGINNLSSSFSDGGVNECQLSLTDGMSDLGSQENPKLPIYRNILVSDFLDIIFTSVGLSQSDWILDSSYTNTRLVFGITVGTKVRDTLNALAQYLQARIVKDRLNRIKIAPASATTGNSYTLSYELVNNLQSAYVRSADYDKVNLTYNPNENTLREVILSDSNHTIVSTSEGQETIINDLTFRGKVLSIEILKVRYNKRQYKTIVNIDSFSGSQDTLEELVLTAKNETGESEDIEIKDLLIYAEGNVLDTTTNTVAYPDIDNNDNNINIEIAYIIPESQAETMAQNLYNLVKLMSRKIVINTFATPNIDLGDTVVLSDDDYENYKGTYRVIGYNVSHGEDYHNQLTLIKLS